MIHTNFRSTTSPEKQRFLLLSFLLVSKIFTRCSEEFSPEFPSICQARESTSGRNADFRKFQTNAHCAHINQFDKLCNKSKAFGLLCRPSGQHTRSKSDTFWLHWIYRAHDIYAACMFISIWEVFCALFPILVVGLLNIIHYNLNRICSAYILRQSWYNRPIVGKSWTKISESCVNSCLKLKPRIVPLKAI